jgi:hypothetical protein
MNCKTSILSPYERASTKRPPPLLSAAANFHRLKDRGPASVPGLIISVSRYLRFCFLLWACSLDRAAFGVLSFWNVPCPWHIAFSLVLSRGAMRFRGVS